jgi:hypothetical protein
MTIKAEQPSNPANMKKIAYPILESPIGASNAKKKQTPQFNAVDMLET